MRRLWAGLLLAAFLVAILLPAGSGALARQPPPGITREGTIRLLVEDTDNAIAAIQRLVARMGGTVEASERWTDQRYGYMHPYATLVVSLPNVQLENTMQSLRSMSLDVLQQNIASRDTAPQYADLTARRSYLEGQRDRLEDLLELATSDSDRQALQTQQDAILVELANVEEQLNALWWAQHDARLTIHLEPFVPIPTPTLRPTLRPTHTPQPWDPLITYRDARDTLSFFRFHWYYYLCCGGAIVLVAVVIMLLAARRKQVR